MCNFLIALVLHEDLNLSLKLFFLPFLTGKMKSRTDGIANPNSSMVAPSKQERENEWIAVQSKKSCRLA